VRPYLLDVNVLLALSMPTHSHHLSATAWFDEGDFEWATTPMTEAGFLRLTTNPQVTGMLITAAQAVLVLQELREAPGFRFLPDDSSLADPVIDLGPLAGSKQITDFHLVNLAARAGMRLATFDGALERSLSDADRWHVFVIED
jgi:uncharacterized protein